MPEAETPLFALKSKKLADECRGLSISSSKAKTGGDSFDRAGAGSASSASGVIDSALMKASKNAETKTNAF
jgi:hypothetical protein